MGNIFIYLQSEAIEKLWNFFWRVLMKWVMKLVIKYESSMQILRDWGLREKWPKKFLLGPVATFDFGDFSISNYESLKNHMI